MARGAKSAGSGGTHRRSGRRSATHGGRRCATAAAAVGRLRLGRTAGAALRAADARVGAARRRRRAAVGAVRCRQGAHACSRPLPPSRRRLHVPRERKPAGAARRWPVGARRNAQGLVAAGAAVRAAGRCTRAAAAVASRLETAQPTRTGRLATPASTPADPARAGRRWSVINSSQASGALVGSSSCRLASLASLLCQRPCACALGQAIEQLIDRGRHRRPTGCTTAPCRSRPAARRQRHRCS